MLSHAGRQYIPRGAPRLGTMIARDSIALVRWPDATKKCVSLAAPAKHVAESIDTIEQAQRKSFVETFLDIYVLQKPWRYRQA
jgi:hypothetical protein